MRRNGFWGLVAVSAMALAVVGCSGNKDLYAPVEAPEIASAFSLERVWSASAGKVGKFATRLTPALEGGVIFVASRDGDVRAFNAQGGERLWSRDLSDEDEQDDRRSARLSGGVAARLGKVAVGSENGFIYVLSASDGSIAWKKDLESEIATVPAFSSSGAALFVVNGHGEIMAFSSANGDELWSAGGGKEILSLRGQAQPLAIGDDYLLVGETSGKILVLSQSTGAVVNEILVGEAYGANDLERISDVSASPLALGDDLYATSYAGSLLHYSLGSQGVISRLPYQSSKPLAFDGDSLVLTDDRGHVHCLNRADGTERWANTRLSYRSVSAPAIYGNYVVVGDFEGYLYFMSLNDGIIRGMFDTDGSGIYARPISHAGNLYVVTRDGDLDCLRHDPDRSAAFKADAAEAELASAGAGVDLRSQVAVEGAIPSTGGITAEQLQARRDAAMRLVAENEARIRAAQARQREYERQYREYQKQKAAYEAAVKEEEQRQRRAVSGFGLMPGVRSDAEVQSPAGPTAPAGGAVESQDAPSREEVDPNAKASGFGL
ncbi:MAG: outer membrane protein assembly factor BamB [Succinivibrionaceae bacterium]|nr:outer membrane protein assembly factor BamB [Succinivibrionaceae bacterium]